MALLQVILTFAYRSVGKALNAAFGWATIMLFGKVPRTRQLYLSIIAFVAVAWIIAVLGIAFPKFAAFLLTFAHGMPDWVRPWIRTAMLAAALLLPPVIGFLSLYLHSPDHRPKQWTEKAKVCLRGYPYALGLAITLLMMILFAPILKLRDLIRRWTSAHIPVIVGSRDYLEVVDELQRTLQVGGFPTFRKKANWMLRLPTKVLTALAGGAVQNLMADQLTTLVSHRIEVLLHPSDLVVRGREKDVARARAIVAEQLAFSKAHLTWSKEGNDLEDRLGGLWRGLRSRSHISIDVALADLSAIDAAIRKAQLPYEEWEALFREKLLVERSLLRVAAGITDAPKDSMNERDDHPVDNLTHDKAWSAAP